MRKEEGRGFDALSQVGGAQTSQTALAELVEAHYFFGLTLDHQTRLKRLRFRSWHRGTKEADMMVGGFFNRFSDDWNEVELAWFEMLMDEQDVDIMAWATGAAPAPPHVAGPMLTAMQRLDYITIPK